ncbi:hypothetical protein DL89DRAFT_267674 [Linderina pennispora]|uniref:F-box domain-containing protein n=1 Tax=Linderina pennispora TaxID=61395 RepID=A0A1Y1W893_9FUNG|nr:uncharacterized protein DL89DRAFT_267674 [Linderina pennispora]ORX69456.1 hypothetical protein DL89DRAFT_267674 [Linderina pennispora]
MDLKLSSAQNALPSILSLIFDRIKYGKKLKNEWERLDQIRKTGGAESLRSIAQVCRSWRTAALPYFYENAVTLLEPVLGTSAYYPRVVYPDLSMAAAGGHSQLVRSAHFRLSLDHIIDGTSTHLLDAGALSTATFPNVTELVLDLYSSDDIPQGNHSAKVGSFIERIRQLFPNAQDSSLVVRSGSWIDYEYICRNLMGIIAPAPRTLIFRDLANEDAVLRGGFSTGIQRMHLETHHSTECPIVHSNRDTVEELVLRIAPYYGEDMTEGNISDSLESLFSYTYPKLTSLSIETGQDMEGRFSLPDINPFPSLTTLSLNTYCGFDIGVIVDSVGENLTSLTLYLTDHLFKSLCGRVFPSLACVRIRETAIASGRYGIGDVVEAAHLPFLIAPNAEHIENYYHSLPFHRSLQSFIPQNHSNPQLRHLIVRKVMPTLGRFQQILACFPGLTRIGIYGVRADEGYDPTRSDSDISRLLTELPIFSTSLRRIDLQLWRNIGPHLVVAIAKLPLLRMVTIGAASNTLSQYRKEIGKPIYDEYRDSLSRPIFCSKAH